MTTYPTGIVASLLPGINGILGVRDSIGAIKQPIFFLTRTWFTDIGLSVAATQPEGYAKDSVTQLLPSPGMKQFSQDVRLREGGAIKAGDIILTAISRQSYSEQDLDGTSSAPNIEKLYLIGNKVYEPINVTQKYVTFSVQVRQLTNQQRY